MALIVIGCWIALFVCSLPALRNVEGPLKVGGFSSPNTEAARARGILERDLGASPSTLVVIFKLGTLRASDPKFSLEIEETLAGVDQFAHVVDVVTPDDDRSLIAQDGQTAYALVGLDLPPEEAQRLVPDFRAKLGHPADLDALVAGGPAFYADIETVSQRDLRRAELIAFPFALVALLLVFGTVVAAAVPLAVGGLGVAAILLSLYGIAHATDLSIFVLNLATMLGLGSLSTTLCS